jgi:hypothetical protein
MTDVATASAIRVSEQEAELALAEAHAVLAAVGDDGYRQQLDELVEAIEAGSLGEDEAATLEPIVELALQTGRARALYGPPGEQAALRLYRKLPGGKALARSASEVSAALASLQGQRLEGATVTATGPGTFSVTLATDEGTLTVRLDRQGARVASVEV